MADKCPVCGERMGDFGHHYCMPVRRFWEWMPDTPPQGWQCPICKAVRSPTTPQCLNCKGE